MHSHCRICATGRAFLDLRPSPTDTYSWNHCSSAPVSGRLTSSLPRAPAPCGCSSTEATSFSKSCRRACSGAPKRSSSADEVCSAGCTVW
ncbi:hypothetical protein VTK26DRAFT_2832 [Humicola hyalothermophila]